MIFFHNGRELSIRRANLDDTSSVRQLINEAYKELSDRGWNYTGSYQDDTFTANQIVQRRVFVLYDGPQLIATISAHDDNKFTKRRTLYVGKFAVLPNLKRQGLGSLLMQYIENVAKIENYEGLQLDTAKPAHYLVRWYQGLGYKIVGETHFEDKTYDSWIFEKLVSHRT